MAKVKELMATYRGKKPDLKSRSTHQRRQFVHDERGKRVAVILDLPTYEKLIEAQEDLEDIRDFDECASRALAEYRRGEYVTLKEYKRQVKAKRR